MRALACLALLALVLAAHVEAAPPQATLDLLERAPLPPGTTTVPANLTLTYDRPSANATNLALRVLETPSWLRARIEPATLAAEASNASGRTVVPVQLLLTVANGTAALTQGAVRIGIGGEENAPLEAFNSTADLPVQVGYVGALRFTPGQDEFRGRPGEPVRLELRVANVGNGPARVTLEPAGTTKEVQIVPPSPFIVEAGERVVNVSALGTAPGTYPLQLRYTSTHAFDQRIVGPSGDVTLNLDLLEGGVPGFETLTLLAALALVVAARQRI